VRGREREAELGLAPFVAPAHAHITDQPRFVAAFYRVLEPAQLARIGRRQFGHEPFGVGQRKRRIPRLVASDLGIGPVRGEGRLVTRPEAAEHQPRRL
jgi:hypothetical protein